MAVAATGLLMEAAWNRVSGVTESAVPASFTPNPLAHTILPLSITAMLTPRTWCAAICWARVHRIPGAPLMAIGGLSPLTTRAVRSVAELPRPALPPLEQETSALAHRMSNFVFGMSSTFWKKLEDGNVLPSFRPSVLPSFRPSRSPHQLPVNPTRRRDAQPVEHRGEEIHGAHRHAAEGPVGPERRVHVGLDQAAVSRAMLGDLEAAAEVVALVGDDDQVPGAGGAELVEELVRGVGKRRVPGAGQPLAGGAGEGAAHAERVARGWSVADDTGAARDGRCAAHIGDGSRSPRWRRRPGPRCGRRGTGRRR